MSQKPYQRTQINPREKPLSNDINELQSQLDFEMRFTLEHLLGWRLFTDGVASTSPPSGFVGDGCQVVLDTGLDLTIRKGLGFQYDATDVPTDIDGCIGLDDLAPLKPIVLTDDVSVTVPAPDVTNGRWDIIEVKYDHRSENPLSRNILNLVTGKFTPQLVNKTFSPVLGSGQVTYNGSGAINYKTGVAAPSPSIPTTDAGYIRIARIFVPANAVAVDSAKIFDSRRVISPNGTHTLSVAFDLDATTLQIVGTPTFVAPPGTVMGVFTASPGSVPGFGVVIAKGPIPDLSTWAQGSNPRIKPIITCSLCPNHDIGFDAVAEVSPGLADLFAHDEAFGEDSATWTSKFPTSFPLEITVDSSGNTPSDVIYLFAYPILDQASSFDQGFALKGITFVRVNMTITLPMPI